MNPSQIIDILLLIYYTPVLAISVYNSIRYGLKNYPEWKYLALLGLFRIVAAATGIAASSTANSNLVVVSLIFSSIGNTLLIACLLGLATRINSHLEDKGVSQRVTRLAHLILLVALILGIVGGNYQVSNNVELGRRLTQVSNILLWLVFVIILIVCAKAFGSKLYLTRSLHRLNVFSLISTPFLFVRLIYASCSAFRPYDMNFSFLSTTITAVIIRAILGTLMEWVVVALYLGALISYQWTKVDVEEPFNPPPPYKVDRAKVYQNERS